MTGKAPRILIALVSAFACLLSACEKNAGGNGNSAPRGSGDTILVGEFGSMTGSEATFGQSTHAGIMQAVEEFNAAGGINGKKIEVKSYDDEGKGQMAGTVVTRLVTDDKVVAVLGEVASNLSIAGGRVCQQYKIPMISPSSTNAQVTQIGNMIFRVCFLDPFQGYAGAKFARESLKANKVALLFDQGQSYSKGLKDDFAREFKSMGGTIATEQAFTGGDQDFSAQLNTIRGTNPDAIYLPAYYTDVGNVALQARKLGITVPLIGGDGWDSAKLVEIGGAAIEGCYYTNHYSHEEKRKEVQDFVNKYKAEHKGQVPDALAALGYDAAKLLFDAMKRAKSLEGPDLAAAIAESRDFNGVTGVFSIDKERNARKPAMIIEIKGGQHRYVTTIQPPN
jgi:branched-chain amino acid transport system substrate-binding protein